MKEKLHKIGFPTFKLPANTKEYFMTDPLNIIFDDFDMWLLGYRIKFSCLYLPQGHTLISTCTSTMWLWSTDEYVFFGFLLEIYL